MTTANQYLQEVLDLLTIGWCQNTLWKTRDGVTRYCASGAFDKIRRNYSGYDPDDPIDHDIYDDIHPLNLLQQKFREWTKTQYRPHTPNFPDNSQHYGGMVEWNDYPDRTQAEVINALTTVLTTQEEEGVTP